MNKLHRSRYINVVVSMMMAFLMLAAMGTTQVHAAQYTTGTIDPAELKAGDVVYRGPIRIIRIRWDIASLTGILILTAPAHC